MTKCEFTSTSTSRNSYSNDVSERLRLVPDVLESLISEKRLLQAAVLLVRSLKTIKKQDMLDIGAVADLRAYLIGQESVRAICFVDADMPSITNHYVQALRDILIDELHNHLYLKSFWCENRWVAYVVGQQSSESSRSTHFSFDRSCQYQKSSLKMSRCL